MGQLLRPQEVGLRYCYIPLVALACSLDTVLKKVGSELRALLLVAIGIGTISVRVSLRCSLELVHWGGSLSGHGRSVHIVVVTRLLS